MREKRRETEHITSLIERIDYSVIIAIASRIILLTPFIKEW